MKPVLACFPAGQKDKPINTDEFIRELDESLRKQLTKKPIFKLVDVSSQADAEMHVEIDNLYLGAGMPGFFTVMWIRLQGLAVPFDPDLARCTVFLTTPAGNEVLAAYWSKVGSPFREGTMIAHEGTMIALGVVVMVRPDINGRAMGSAIAKEAELLVAAHKQILLERKTTKP
ncbi:hypothetical protein FJY63_04060 [Candidatus Sumerlaeota bacterium]|nr:hypothetical protein [Candidatus Sumerlaeota bacterium]